MTTQAPPVPGSQLWSREGSPVGPHAPAPWDCLTGLRACSQEPTLALPPFSIPSLSHFITPVQQHTQAGGLPRSHVEPSGTTAKSGPRNCNAGGREGGWGASSRKRWSICLGSKGSCNTQTQTGLILTLGLHFPIGKMGLMLPFLGEVGRKSKIMS